MRSLLKKPPCALTVYLWIKYNKYLDVNEIPELAKELGVRTKTIERRLNKSECPVWIQTVYKKGDRVGYKYSKKRTKKVIC